MALTIWNTRRLALLLVTAVAGLRNLICGRSRQAQRSRMRDELEIMSVKRRDETLAFAKCMIASIETNQLGPDAIDLLAEILSRPGCQVSGQAQVVSTLQYVLKDPDYLRPHFGSLESEWLYEKQVAEIVRGRSSEGLPPTPPASGGDLEAMVSGQASAGSSFTARQPS